jgi:hypothetical protein
MKRMMKTGLAFFVAAFAGPLWAHHAAEGIISDDVWQMIDENLQEVDSPHLNIDFDDVIGSMGSAEEGGRMYLVTTITVEEEYAEVYLAEIELAVDAALLEAVEDQMAPAGIVGTGNSKTFDVEIFRLEDGSGYVDIVLYELIGQGASQTEFPVIPVPQTGQR